MKEIESIVLLRGIIHKRVSPFVLIGSPRPLSPQASVSPPPGNKEGGNTRLQVRGRGEPIQATGEKAWHSVYSMRPFVSTPLYTAEPEFVNV